VTRTVPDPSVHAFFAGAPADLVAIEAMLAVMPLCTYGQVVIESDDELPVLELPRRVQLRRVAVVRSVTGDSVTGEAVARAADAWLEEWMPDEQLSAKPSRFAAWVGCEGSEAAAEAGARIEHSLRARHTGV
jgi:NADPH-dependent ferric siderophore reductase